MKIINMYVYMSLYTYMYISVYIQYIHTPTACPHLILINRLEFFAFTHFIILLVDQIYSITGFSEFLNDSKSKAFGSNDLYFRMNGLKYASYLNTNITSTRPELGRSCRAYNFSWILVN